MNKDYLFKGCAEIIWKLCQLVDTGEMIDRTLFHDLCEREHFLNYLQDEYPNAIQLNYFNEESSIGNLDVIEYFNDAMMRHANVVVMEDYRLSRNPLLLAINIVSAIMQEIYCANT